jgi:alkaline phosphatase D
LSITGNWDRRISRQTFLGISGMSAAALVLGAQGVWLPRRGLAQTTTDSNPFKPLGVASGDPLLNSVVLWTRLAPDPLNGGGMPDGEVTVDWEVASDSSFSDASRVRSGQYTAKPDLAHSVHVDAGVEGTGDTLKPATTYYYRFEVDKKSDGTYAYTSPTGRTKTAPDPNASSVSRMKFAFVSCQHWESDLYPTYGHIAAQPDLDLVVHLGDYIYEGAPSSGKVTRKNPDGTYSYHSAVADPSFGCTTLADYRNRHAQYKTDQILQAAHAAHPWAVTWDDHEVENDYAGTNSWYSRAILPRGGLPPTRPTTSTGTGPGPGTRKPGTATLPPVTASSNTSRITRCPPRSQRRHAL